MPNAFRGFFIGRLRKAGNQMESRFLKCKKTTERDEEYVFAYRLTWSQTEAAEMCSVSRETIARAVRRAGISLCGRKLNGKKTAHGNSKISDIDLLEACKTMTCDEIAQKYGMHRESLPRRFRQLGVKPVGYGTGEYTQERIDALQEASRKYWAEHPGERPVLERIYGDCWHYVETHHKLIQENHPNVLYLESRSEGLTKIRLKCRCCGAVSEYDRSVVRNQNIKCKACEEKKREQQAIANERIRLIRFLYALKESKTPKKCKCCGKEFYSVYPTKLYCSDKCKRKARKKKVNQSIRRRCHRYGVFYDNTITNDAVFMRDGYVCQICGKPCDTTDKSWGHCGPMSPSVDHIIPLVSGGTHTWDNVQCAHVICNSYKRDQVVG